MHDFDTMSFIISMAGVIIFLCISVISWFLARAIKQIEINKDDIGKNKGRIDLVKQRQQTDVYNLEKNLNTRMDALERMLQELSKDVKELIKQKK